MGTGNVALTSENGEIKRNVSFGKSKPELAFLYIVKSRPEEMTYMVNREDLDKMISCGKKEYKKILK